MTTWSWRPQPLEVQGVVEASSRYTIELLPGEVRWTLEQHGKAEGLSVVSQGSIQLENGEQVAMEVAPGLGSTVTEGEAVALLRSELVARMADELEARRDALEADLELLREGGRPETIRSAEQAVEVARSQVKSARTEAERLQGISEGAIATASVEAAQQLLAVRERELSLAQAKLAEARQPPRPAEIAALEAELARIDSRLAEVRTREASATFVSPITGDVIGGTEGVVVAVLGDDERYARVPLPQAERRRVNLGDEVLFASSLGSPVGGRVVDISSEAQPLGQQAVFWVAVRLDDARLPPGAFGTARFQGRGQ